MFCPRWNSSNSIRPPDLIANRSIACSPNSRKAARWPVRCSNSTRWLPEFDIALIDAGERSGRLDACFRLLADYYNDQARITKQMISQLLYPVGLVHLAAIIFIIVLPFARSQFNASLIQLTAKAALALAPLYLATAFIIYATQSRHGEKWRALIESVFRWIPLLGKARHFLALARLAAALEALISAGVNIIQAWDLAANASGSPALRRAVASMKPKVVAGQTPAEEVRKCSAFPVLFANLYASGEVSGKLDETLRRLYAHYQEEGSHKLQMFAQWMPRLIYGLVAALVAYNVIKFWTGYFASDFKNLRRILISALNLRKLFSPDDAE